MCSPFPLYYVLSVGWLHRSVSVCVRVSVCILLISCLDFGLQAGRLFRNTWPTSVLPVVPHSTNTHTSTHMHTH